MQESKTEAKHRAIQLDDDDLRDLYDDINRMINDDPFDVFEPWRHEEQDLVEDEE